MKRIEVTLLESLTSGGRPHSRKERKRKNDQSPRDNRS